MSCVICVGLQGSVHRYVASVLNRRTKDAHISESLVNTLGYCGWHTAALQTELGNVDKFRESAQQAARWLIQMTMNTHTYEGRLSEIRFRSRSACPACLYQRRMEGRLIARFVRAAPASKRLLTKYLDGQVCLNHLYAMTPHFLEAGLGSIAMQVLNKTVKQLRRKFDTWDMDAGAAHAEISAAFAAQRAELAEAIGSSCHVPEPDETPVATAVPACACTVCAAVRDARVQWQLRLAQTVDFGYPLRLVAPTCPVHVLGCLLDGPIASGYAAWSRFLHPENRFPKNDAAPAAARRQRKGASWNLERPDDAEAESVVTHDLAHLNRFCPACSAAEIARTRAVLSFSAQHRSVPDHHISLCMKHFAEVYILEPRKPFRQTLAAYRMQDLERDAAQWPVWAFGQFS